MPKTPSQLSAEVARLVRGRRVVVGLSGGLDSVTLTHLLVRGGADVRAAHVDHGLRPDSADDAAFCANIAANLGISFGCAQLNVERGNSTQGRARIQRYAALVRLATELGGDLLAVAHHADDAWESSQLQIGRGSGPVGAAGPKLWSAWHGFDVVRPLLAVRRQTLAGVAAELELQWRDDPSNTDVAYRRTRVRAQSNFDAALLRDRRADAAELETAADVFEPARHPTARVFDRELLAAVPSDTRRRVLLDAARELHGELSAAVARDLSDAVADGNSSLRTFCGRRVAVTVEHDDVRVVATRGQGTRLLDDRTTSVVEIAKPCVFDWFDHQLELRDRHVGFTLRGPRHGDRVDGRGVYDLLARSGVPRCERWRWPCIFDGDECVEVFGVFSLSSKREDHG